jgi:hypothetical protein
MCIKNGIEDASALLEQHFFDIAIVGQIIESFEQED